MVNGADGNGMRAVKFATIAMGVLILLGTTVILVTIVKRTMSGPIGSGPAASDKPFATLLDEPAGATVAGIASAGDRLAVHLHGGGADRVVLINPVSGAVVGRIGVAR